MKKVLTAFSMFLFYSMVLAQTNPLDKQLEKINQASVTSGIIYDRVMPLADLCIFNMPSEKPHNTANFRFFKQALFELHKASNYKKLISIEKLEEKIAPYNNKWDVVPIGIINTPFQSLNYNPENPKESGLILKDSIFVQVDGNKPFLNGYAMVISPLKNVMQGEKIIYQFSEELIFNNGETKIKTLIVDFGNGEKQKIIVDGMLITKEVVFENYKNNGDKNIHFIVELNNEFTFETNATIYTVFGNSSNNSLKSQLPACSSNIPDTNGLIENFKVDNSYVQATDSFQGLNESVALKAQIEPRVFYHTNNGNTQKTLLKPIIIVDGFDPSDGRKIDDCDCYRDPVCQEANKDKTTGVYNPDNHTSFVELMEYKNEANNNTNLITVLRERGYDVIIVNQPTYTTNGVTVDGGADFIERNAMAFIELIKEVNTKLQTNGSSEKLVVLGPSMGGQITRYALAYMEKKFAETSDANWQHNTRIWVAFDSPNHGANVPLGDQALIKMLADDSIEALKSFNKLQTIAANEMLVNYYKENATINQSDDYSNASTISQGMPNSKGNPYFQEHYNRQFDNGLPNSHGFPMNLRKLAIVNGSLSGETFGNGYEKMLEVKLSKQICLVNWTIFGWHFSSCFSSKLFQAESYTIPTSNNVVAHKMKLGSGNSDYNASVNSIRGNLDNVPGGSIDATGLLHSAITGEDLGGPRSFWQYPFASASNFYLTHIGNGAEWETTVLKPNQCFIPTYSSIGIKDPNQSWAKPLNRNLVCSNETYFDSYFGESNNTTHVELNYRSVNWLLKEIGSNLTPPIEQSPYFPLQPDLISGPNSLCNSNATYSISDICKVPSEVEWSVSPNLQIVSLTSYSITVSQISNGEGTLTATFQNGQTLSKTIWVGTPSFTFEYNYFEPQPIKSTICVVSDNPDITLQQQGITNLTYKFCNSITVNNISNSYCMMPKNNCCIEFTATNNCGSTTVVYDCFLNKQITNNNYYNIYPNPSSDIVNIEIRDENNIPEKEATILGELFDMMGLSIAKVEIINNKATFSVSTLNKGIYILKIHVNEQVESHQISVE